MDHHCHHGDSRDAEVLPELKSGDVVTRNGESYVVSIEKNPKRKEYDEKIYRLIYTTAINGKVFTFKGKNEYTLDELSNDGFEIVGRHRIKAV